MSNRLEHALALAERGFWVFPVVPNSKLPALKDWPNAATRDVDQINAWWSSRDYNIGISTSRYQDSMALLTIDVDNKKGKNGDGSILELELQGCELPVSFEQSTPGNGRHILYVVDAPLKQGVNVLGAGLDIRSKGGYIVGPGSEIEGRAYAQINGHDTLAAAPDWLVARLGRDRSVDRHPGRVLDGVDAARARDRAVDYLKTAPRSTEGDGGDITAYRVAAKLKDLGCTADQANDLMLNEWNDDCDPPWDDDELADKVNHAFKYGKEPQGSAAPEAVFAAAPAPVADESGDDAPPYMRFNDCYSFVTAGGGHILHETTDAYGVPMLDHMDIATFHLKHAAEKISVGDKTVALTKQWIVSAERRSYTGFVFAPEQPAPAGWYNLWRGFSIKPAATPDHPMVARFIEHCRENICQGDEKLARWLLGYFAHMVQRPWEKPLTALVFKGRKGTGKNALIERIGKLFGSHFLVTSKRRYLTSQFNGHFENCLCIALDEAFWSGDKESEGILKDLVTGDHHVIEHKGKSTYKVKNLTRVVIIGNESWVVPASTDERRFAVFNVGDGRQQDRKYFHELRVGLDEKGGNAHLLRYLLDFDLATVDVNQAPSTQGLLEQKLASLEPMEKWWHECLTEGVIAGGDFAGEWPESIARQRLRDAFKRWSDQHNIRSRILDAKDFGRKLNAMAEVGGKQARFRIEGALAYAYKIPPLADARMHWDRFTGHDENWED